jgi:hypothetical protein
MNREFARNQIGRFAMMDRFPRTEVSAITDLVDALMTCPPSRQVWRPDVIASTTNWGSDDAEALARLVVEGFLEGATTDTRCPTAADIKSAICSRLHESRPDPDCPLCKGEGFPYVPGRGSGPKCSCWQRRPAPTYPRPGDERVGREFAGEIARAAQGKRA